MFFKNLRKKISDRRVIKDWERSGRPAPPPHLVKQALIKGVQEKYNYNVFVETGTYLGEMVEAQLFNFHKIYSVELGEKLFSDAKQKFSPFPHVRILQGDSADVLKDIIAQLDKPAIFWLDGHYSAGITAMGQKSCPTMEELSAIFNGKLLNHVILIDDARLFVGKDDYPTIPELSAAVRSKRPMAEITNEDDVIRILLK